MRKTLLLAILIPCLSLGAATVSRSTPGLDISGIIGKNQTFTVELVELSSDRNSGVPFSLDHDTVQSTHASGRQIATWNLRTNYTPVTLTITASPLTNSSGETVPYVLSFPYQFSYIDEGSSEFKTLNGQIDLEVGTDTATYSTENDKGSPFETIRENSPLIFTGDYPIRFKLRGSSDGISVGVYTADVTLTVKGE